MSTLAVSKYKEIVDRTGGEILVSGSDDFTLFLWQPEKNKKSIGKLTYNFKIQNLLKCTVFN